MRSISASVFDTAGCVSDRNSAARPEMAELVERHQQLQMPQLEVGAQDAVDVGHGGLHNQTG